MIAKFGGRKFLLSMVGILTIGALALLKADATSFGAIAVIVGAYNGANGFVEGKYAK